MCVTLHWVIVCVILCTEIIRTILPRKKCGPAQNQGFDSMTLSNLGSSVIPEQSDDCLQDQAQMCHASHLDAQELSIVLMGSITGDVATQEGSDPSPSRWTAVTALNSASI